MAKYAIIQDNVITNIIEAEEEYAVKNNLIAITGNVGIGWTFDGSNFLEPDVIALEPNQPTKDELLAQLQNIQSQIQNLN